jgi:PAS domain S-box-containing protein
MIQNLYMNAPAFVCTFRGPKHIYDLVNPSYQKLFGSRKIQGKPIIEALPELEGQGFDKILDNVYHTGEIFVGKGILISLAYDEGQQPAERYFNFSYQPIYDEENKITGILVFGYEVTEEIRARKEAESAERFRILADAMPEKMSTTDENGNLNYINHRWYDYTHFNLEEMKEWGWEKIIHPDDWAKTQNKWMHSFSTGQDYQLEHRFRRHDGVYHWHLSRGVAKKDTNGKIIGWTSTYTDIEDQKQAEEKIRIAEEFSSSVLQNSPDCVKVLDKEGLISFMNTNGLCEMEIEDFNIIKGKPWWELWGQENKSVIDAALITAHTGKTAQFQAYCATAKGTPKWWDVIVTPILNSDGAVTQLISVSRDITERIKKDQKKDEFISIASHEMKTPLTSTKGYLQLLEMMLDASNEEALLIVSKALTSVNRLNNLITELLDISKIQNGKLDYNITVFDFNKMVADTMEDQLNTSPGYTIIKTGNVPSEIKGDRNRLQQVIINLISNAVKYSPDDKQIVVTIQETNGELVFSVKDNGIGIAKENLENVFKRYFRVKDQIMRFQGMGIGLYISNEIITRHQGKMWIESELGTGSTIYFSIPLT